MEEKVSNTKHTNAEWSTLRCLLELEPLRPEINWLQKGFRPITSVAESQILAFYSRVTQTPWLWAEHYPQTSRGALTFDYSTPLMSPRSPRVQSEIGSSHNLSLYKKSSDTC